MAVSAAVIGGTGFYDPNLVGETRRHVVETPYGTVAVSEGRVAGQRVVFLARHGLDHALPPHRVNYRANLWACGELGVERIIATGATGSMRRTIRPGDFVICDQFLDFTHSRSQTFHEGGEQGVAHVDLTHPYCPELRSLLITAAKEQGRTVHETGCYVCTEGPRFETPAEIRMFRQLGGDVVGMTNVPEVVLARELGICYSLLALPSNPAAGMSDIPVQHQDVLDAQDRIGTQVAGLVLTVMERLTPPDACGCRQGAAQVFYPQGRGHDEEGGAS